MSNTNGGRQDAAMVIDDLVVEFPTASGTVQAVNGVSLTLRAGERLAIVGESGSGKSALMMAAIGMPPFPGRIVRGSVTIADEVVQTGPASRDLRGRKVGVVFQDPMSSLNPVMRIDHQLGRPLRRYLGLTRAQARLRILELFRLVGLPDPESVLVAYPHQLSGGQRQRVLIAMAISRDPVVLVADEPTTALDVTVQAQIAALLRELADTIHTATVLVTHDLGEVARFADRVIVLYAGRVVEQGRTRQIFTAPRHPYTRGLLASIPTVSTRTKTLVQIPGAPPDLRDLPPGCDFAPRCGLVQPRCRTERPPLETDPTDHAAACWVVRSTSNTVESR